MVGRVFLRTENESERTTHQRVTYVFFRYKLMTQNDLRLPPLPRVVPAWRLPRAGRGYDLSVWCVPPDCV